MKKPENEVTAMVVVLFFVQTVLMPVGVRAQSSGQQIAGAALGVASAFATKIPEIYSQSPSTPNFSNATVPLAQQMKQCETKSFMKDTFGLSASGTSAEDQKKIVSEIDYWRDKYSKDKNKTNTKSTEKFTCASTCPNKPKVKEPDCETLAGPLEAPAGKDDLAHPKMYRYQFSEVDFQSAKNKIDSYLECKEVKQNCPDPKRKQLQQDLETFQCQMQVLQAAVQQSATILQTSLQANQTSFAAMNQHQKEVGEQIQQVDEILGPDPELGKSGASQFQGLLGMQKELQETLPKMTAAEADYKTRIETLKNETTTNEQNLESSRVNVASACIKGSRNVGVAGGYSLTCFKPRQIPGPKDASGQPTFTPATNPDGSPIYSKQSCGPYEYIRSKIEQQAFITSRGIIMDQFRREKAAADATAFDSLVDSINRSMGDYDQKSTNNARLDVDVHSWADIEAKVSANIDAVSNSSKVDIRSMLRTIGGHCFHEADGWRNKQIRSSDSEYSRKKADLLKTKTTMTAEMDTGLTSMNKHYKDLMAVLGRMTVTVDRTTCTKTDPDKMHACFAAKRQNIQDLVEGRGNLSQTAYPIKGGPSTPPFTVPCRGLNGCVTVLQNVRKDAKDYIKARQKDKEANVNKGNTETTQALNALTKQLSGMQNSLLAQFDKMRGALVGLGIDTPEKPNFMEAESLKPMQGPPPDHAPGPFENPKNMSAVLSGMMQPGGMINFSDTGLRQAQKDLIEKDKEAKAALKADIDEVKEVAEAYNLGAFKKKCSIAGGSSGGDNKSRVGNSKYSCSDCAREVNACNKSFTRQSEKNVNKINEIGATIESLQKQRDDLQAVIDKKGDKASVTDLRKLEDLDAKIAKKTDERDRLLAESESGPSYQEFEDTIKTLTTTLESMKKVSGKDDPIELSYQLKDGLSGLGSTELCSTMQNQCNSCASDAKSDYLYSKEEKESGDSKTKKANY